MISVEYSHLHKLKTDLGNLKEDQLFTTTCQCGLFSNNHNHSNYQFWSWDFKCFIIENDGSWEKADLSLMMRHQDFVPDAKVCHNS